MMAMSVFWPIDRRWTCLSGSEEHQTQKTTELARWRACVLLGFAGSGKTHELKILAETDRNQGRSLSNHELLDEADSCDSLRTFLAGLLEDCDGPSAIFLDGLDELLVQVPNAARVLAKWVRTSVELGGHSIRITCRTAVWQNPLQDALHEVFGEKNVIVARLDPLSEEDVWSIATAEGIDASRFLAEIERVDAQPLAQQPLAVRLLLSIFREDGSLPKSRLELMRRGVATLARERRQREKTAGAHLTSSEALLRFARRLACLRVLTGIEVVDLRDIARPRTFDREQLATAFEGVCEDVATLAMAVGISGLCEGEGEDRFRFFHRQIAEFLASGVIAGLPLHQVQAFLRRRVDGRVCIAGPLRETAAFAAMQSLEIAEWIATVDPEVIGMSEVVDDDLKRRAARGLLDAFRRGQYTDSQVWTAGIDWRGFRHAELARDMLDIIENRDRENDDVLRAAIAMIEECNLSETADGLASLALDERTGFYPRVSAAHAVYKLGADGPKRRLKPLSFGSAGDDDHDLRGIALYCNWPDNLTVTELFDSISTLPADGYIGRYDSFLDSLASDGIDVGDDFKPGLAWAIGVAKAGKIHSSAWRLMQRICLGALDDLDDPETADLLAKVLLAAIKHFESSPLDPPDQSHGGAAGKTNRGSVFKTVESEHRYALIHAIAANASQGDAEGAWHCLLSDAFKAVELPRFVHRTAGRWNFSPIWLIRNAPSPTASSNPAILIPTVFSSSVEEIFMRVRSPTIFGRFRRRSRVNIDARSCGEVRSSCLWSAFPVSRHWCPHTSREPILHDRLDSSPSRTTSWPGGCISSCSRRSARTFSFIRWQVPPSRSSILSICEGCRCLSHRPNCYLAMSSVSRNLMLRPPRLDH